VVFDLRNLDAVELSSIGEGNNRTVSATTRVGTGQRWGAVYDILDPFGMTVVGGRDASVGVGGFLLGGEFPIAVLSSDESIINAYPIT